EATHVHRAARDRRGGAAVVAGPRGRRGEAAGRQARADRAEAGEGGQGQGRGRLPAVPPRGVRQGPGEEVAGDRVPARRRRARVGREQGQGARAAEGRGAEEGLPVRRDLAAGAGGEVVGPDGGDRAAGRGGRDARRRPRPGLPDGPEHGRVRHVGDGHPPPRALCRDRADLRRRDQAPGPPAQGRADVGVPRRQGRGRPRQRQHRDGRRAEGRRRGRAVHPLPRRRARLVDRDVRQPEAVRVVPLPHACQAEGRRRRGQV
ncbi:MAG: hypothetical protein AVDCRST_MAG64-1684, partial [uncultured Phycisphaerae bacterium]